MSTIDRRAEQLADDRRYWLQSERRDGYPFPMVCQLVEYARLCDDTAAKLTPRQIRALFREIFSLTGEDRRRLLTTADESAREAALAKLNDEERALLGVR